VGELKTSIPQSDSWFHNIGKEIKQEGPKHIAGWVWNSIFGIMFFAFILIVVCFQLGLTGALQFLERSYCSTTGQEFPCVTKLKTTCNLNERPHTYNISSKKQK
jgi:hypothetical protein